MKDAAFGVIKIDSKEEIEENTFPVGHPCFDFLSKSHTKLAFFVEEKGTKKRENMRRCEN